MKVNLMYIVPDKLTLVVAALFCPTNNMEAQIEVNLLRDERQGMMFCAMLQLIFKYYYHCLFIFLSSKRRPNDTKPTILLNILKDYE